MLGNVVSLLTARGRRLSGRMLVRVSRAAVIFVAVVADAAGAAVVFAVAAVALPGTVVGEGAGAGVRLFNAAFAGGYLVFAIVTGAAIGLRYFRPVVRWLEADRDPDEREQRRALRAPLVVFAIHAVLWGLAALFFGAINVKFGAELAVRVAIVVTLGGVTTSAIAYLLSERVLRPVAVRALAIGPPRRAAAPRVGARVVLAWSLAAAVPVLGVAILGVDQLIDADASVRGLAVAMVALSGIALAVGLFATLITARTIGRPIHAIHDAVRAIERGDLDVEVRVDDGSELGRLQAGVNRMVAGLRERERLHDLFGRHVGEDVARAAVERGVELGGETRAVAVLFVDVVGSTRLAAERPPQEVVETLNRFFDVVVEVVDEHGGWINKFQGDAALAVFGAPAPLDEAERCALAAARVLAARLADEVPELPVGIGVSGGEAVAGNIGATSRFEYTVIGDPVNEAARLSELAKDAEGCVLAAARLVERAGEAESGHWRVEGEETLRGRREPTGLAVPA